MIENPNGKQDFYVPKWKMVSILVYKQSFDALFLGLVFLCTTVHVEVA